MTQEVHHEDHERGIVVNLALWRYEGKTDDFARKRLLVQDKNKYNAPELVRERLQPLGGLLLYFHNGSF